MNKDKIQLTITRTGKKIIKFNVKDCEEIVNDLLQTEEVQDELYGFQGWLSAGGNTQLYCIELVRQNSFVTLVLSSDCYCFYHTSANDCCYTIEEQHDHYKIGGEYWDIDEEGNFTMTLELHDVFMDTDYCDEIYCLIAAQFASKVLY